MAAITRYDGPIRRKRSDRDATPPWTQHPNHGRDPECPRARGSATPGRETGRMERGDTDGATHGESRKARVDRELIELLNELRVALPGVQVLFAFLLVVPF